MAISKIILNGVTQMDVTNITATEADVAQGKTFLLADGTVGTGTASGGGATYETYYDGSIIAASDKTISIPSLSSLYFASGETWRVTWDGTEYTCYPNVYEGWLWYIGNHGLTDGTDDGVSEPFCLYNYGGDALNGVAKTDGTHTLKLEKQTSSGSSTPSATQHTILFEFTDETTQSITAYWDSSFISDAIRATTPTTVNEKTVALAQFDGVTWYEPADIPIGVQLINYNDVLTGYQINADGSIASSDAWNCVTDYTEIDSSMTFTFACSQYADIGFYDKNKSAIRTVTANDIKDSAESYVAFGTLDSSVIPIGAAYIVMQGNSYSIENLSLIRTA